MKKPILRKRRRRILNRKVEIVLHLLLAAIVIAGIVACIIRYVSNEGVTTKRTEKSRTGETDSLVTVTLTNTPTPTAVPTSTPHPGQIYSIAELIASPGIGNAEETNTDCDWRLILVNPSHKLPEGFQVEVSRLPEDEDVRFDARAISNLSAMVRDCEQAGFSVVIRGAYRTHAQQEELFEEKIKDVKKDGVTEENAEEEAATVVAYPGTSEHELGLACDIVSGEYIGLETVQEDTPTQKWLMANSWKYGFVLRYPTAKSDITGIIYEPWHYRFVGTTAAKIMYEEDLCLEEFLARYGDGTPQGGTGYVSARPDS